jgi:hypothetical protein
LPTKKNIETPEILYDLFVEYKTYAKENPKKENFYNAKEGKEISITREIPYTMVGFENFMFGKGVISTLAHYFMNLDDRYSEYVSICTRIRAEIKQDQIDGGMVGIYNTSITQRLNGLVDKQEHVVKTEQPLFNTDG